MGGSVTSPIMVGRDGDLERLERALADAATGRPQLILMGGEAGIGKTRLVSEAAERARLAGSPVFFGSCLDIGDGGLPYLPIAEGLRGLIRTIDRSTLDRAIGVARHELAAIAPELGPPGTGADAADAVAGSTFERARLFERFIGFFGRLGDDAPALAVIEDLQWVDRASRDLITFLVRNLTTERVVGVLTWRTEELPIGHPTLAWLAELSRAPAAVRLELRRLDRTAVARQLDAIAGGRVEGDLVGRIWRRSEGNPLFVEELLAVASGALDDLRPPSLVEILLARVASLDAAAREVLAGIAVASRPVDERHLAPLLGRSVGEVDASLRTAIQRGLLVVEAGGRYRFRHELLREVVEQELLAGERRTLHERYARLLEERPDLADPSPAGAASELAHHWTGAGRPVEAYRSSLAAAQAAEAVHAFAAAHDHYERALTIEPTLPLAEAPTTAERIEVRRRAADAADLAGEFERAIALVGQALALVDAASDPTTAGLLHSRLGYLSWLAGDNETALQEHQAAVRLVPAEPPSAERARVVGALGGALMGAGRWAESRGLCEEAIGCAIAAGAHAEESRARNMLGSDLVALGEIEAGPGQHRLARIIPSEHGPADMLVVGHHNLALNLLAADHLDEALAEAMAGRTAASAVGLERRFGLDLAALAGDVLTRLGRWNEAEDVVRDAFRLDPRDEGTTYLAAVHARLLALRGDAEGAARRISTIDLSLQDPDVAAFSAAVRAEAALAVGRPEAAAVDVSVGLDHLEGLDDVLWTAPLVGLGLRAVADLADGPPSTDGASDGVDPLAVAARLRSKTGWLAARATTASGRAWVALARAEASRIERPDVPAWEAAVVAWDAVPDPFRAAYARFRLAEARLRAEGLRADAGPDLRSAYEVVTHMGASPLRRQVERLASRARLALEAPSAPVALEIEPPAEPSPARRERRPHRLSERELEVLSLVAAGRTNGEIADRLFITRKTAAVHVTHILDKLGVTNRVEAAMVAARLGLVGEDDDATN